jgi:hypothetical protein
MIFWGKRDKLRIPVAVEIAKITEPWRSPDNASRKSEPSAVGPRG